MSSRVARPEIDIGEEIACRHRTWIPPFGGRESLRGDIAVAIQLGLHPANKEWLGREGLFDRGVVDDREGRRTNGPALVRRSPDFGHSKRQLGGRMGGPRAKCRCGRSFGPLGNRRIANDLEASSSASTRTNRRRTIINAVSPKLTSVPAPRWDYSVP